MSQAGEASRPPRGPSMEPLPQRSRPSHLVAQGPKSTEPEVARASEDFGLGLAVSLGHSPLVQAGPRPAQIQRRREWQKDANCRCGPLGVCLHSGPSAPREAGNGLKAM